MFAIYKQRMVFAAFKLFQKGQPLYLLEEGIFEDIEGISLFTKTNKPPLLLSIISDLFQFGLLAYNK